MQRDLEAFDAVSGQGNLGWLPAILKLRRIVGNRNVDRWQPKTGSSSCQCL
jgi:hypothetical protein